MPPRSDIILALDIGRKKTGIALGNRITGGARPLAIARGDTAQQLAAVAAHISEWRPGALVVGLPVHMDGSAHAMTARARRFAAALQRAHDIPVLFADERQSTRQARRLGQDGDIDDHAAAIILQNWLDGAQHGDIIAP